MVVMPGLGDGVNSRNGDSGLDGEAAACSSAVGGLMD